MRAIVYHGNRDVRLETVPDPQPAPGEVKLRVDYGAICATDIEEYEYGPKFISHGPPHPITGKNIPLVPGHELTGTVVETGDGVEGLRAGDRAVLYGVVSCSKCRWCLSGFEMSCATAGVVGFARDGGLAEYLTWPAQGVIRVPDGVSSPHAALAEPAAVAYHAVHRAHVEPGVRVAVLGTGTVGMLALQAAKAAGAEIYAVDRRQMSLDLALRLGADAAINSETSDAVDALAERTDGDGPDVVIDAAGAPTTPELAVRLTRRGGTVVLVAIYTSTPPFDFNTLVIKEIDVRGSVGYVRNDITEAVSLMADGKIDAGPLVSDVIGLDEVVDVGYARMLQPTKDFFRILVDPSR